MTMPPPLHHKMQIDGASDLSSSSVSSPPTSPQHQSQSDTIHVSSRPPVSHPGFLFGEGVVRPSSATPAHDHAHVANGYTTTQINPHATSTAQIPSHDIHAHVRAHAHEHAHPDGAAPEKPKRRRKKKELGPDGMPVVEEAKEKKPRKPRKPKDSATAGTTAAPRKKLKGEQIDGPKHSPHIAGIQSRQSTIAEMVGNSVSPALPTSSPVQQQPRQYTAADGIMRASLPLFASTAPSPRPRSSGQNYDPIRGSTVEPQHQRLSSNMFPNMPSAPASPYVNRATASPSIASLINPPTTVKTLPTSARASPQTPVLQPVLTQQQFSPPPLNPSTSMTPSAPLSRTSPPVTTTLPVTSTMDGAMEIDSTNEVPDRQPPAIKAPSHSSSAGHSPKATRPTPDPPRGTGSGLLSTSDLFGGPSGNSTDPSERKGVNIDIHIPLNPKGGNTINIAQEIMKKYGRDAINPRAAAHREQLLRIAAEQERLGGGLGDDNMSVDLTSEIENDSTVEHNGGTGGGTGLDDEQKSATGADGTSKAPIRRRRRKKIEEYDKDDDFIDDTELAWQEAAAVAKDGFFVYSGPLVPVGETAKIETATPSTRGGRSGGGGGGGGGTRGRGARGRGGAASTVTGGATPHGHASLADKASATAAADSTAPNKSRKGGKGTSVATGTRKPRATKAEMEERERVKVAQRQAREAAAAEAAGGKDQGQGQTGQGQGQVQAGQAIQGPAGQNGLSPGQGPPGQMASSATTATTTPAAATGVRVGS